MDQRCRASESAPWILATLSAMAIVAGLTFGMKSHPATTSSYELAGKGSINLPREAAREEPTTTGSTAEGR